MSETIVWWEALALGVIQGLTEFLPVSSSGHLALAQSLFGITQGGVAFAVLLHVGTLVAVVLAYPASMARLVKGALRIPRVVGRPTATWPGNELFAAKIALSAVPGGLAGVLLRDRVEAAFARPEAVGLALLATGVLLALTRRIPPSGRDVGFREALIIGLAQSAAILPGISRSGTTIAVALLLGVGRPQAAEFSFLASVPLVLGAALLEAPDALALSGTGPGVVAMGFVTAVLVGWAAIVWLVRLVKAGAFHRFAPYCVLAAALALALAFFR